MSNAAELTILNHYRLTASAADFTSAIAALADRVRHEGEAGVLGYRFFVNPEDHSARAVIDYATPQAWVRHHDIAMPWPEMTALHRVAVLEEVVFLGPLTPDIAAWIATSSLRATIRHGNSFADGFQRPTAAPPAGGQGHRRL